MRSTPNTRFRSPLPQLIIGLAQAYNYAEDIDYRNAGSGVMLGGLGLNLGIWIIYAILLAYFVHRFFLRRSPDAHHANHIAKRIRSITIVLVINAITFPVWLA
jgi:hypothetical protein